MKIIIFSHLTTQRKLKISTPFFHVFVDAGFLLENPLWGNGDSRTIQFLIPQVCVFFSKTNFERIHFLVQSVSQDLFEEICDMVPKIFRVSTARKLTSRPRTHSYK